MHDRVHVAEGGRDRVQIADVGLVRLHARDRAAVERPQGPAPLEAGAHRGADEAAHPRDQDPAHGDDHIMSHAAGAGRALDRAAGRGYSPDREDTAMLDLGLTGKVAIVTGGSEGLGRATAMRLAPEGAHVVICARRKDVLERAAEDIRRQTGVQVLALPADVTRPADVDAVVSAALGTVRRRGHPGQQRGHLLRGQLREGGRRDVGRPTSRSSSWPRSASAGS